MNVYTAAGIVAGLGFGFLLGRAWAEYFRAVRQGQLQRQQRKEYRGKSNFAWVLGTLLVSGVALFFASYG